MLSVLLGNSKKITQFDNYGNICDVIKVDIGHSMIKQLNVFDLTLIHVSWY